MVAPVAEGEILAGKYRVERVLGIGGMGVVVAAHHIQLDKRVALKCLLPEATTNLEVVARFAREARAAVKIESLGRAEPPVSAGHPKPAEGQHRGD